MSGAQQTAARERPGVAVIGCGHWGKNLVRNMVALGALRAVVDPTPAGQERARQLAPDARVLASPEELWRDPEVRGVMVATPAETHYDVACAALEAGKDVFVEKPLTVRLDDARDLVARAEAAERVLMVGHLLEYHPAILRIRELVRDGTLGRLRYVMSNRLNLGKIRTEENALWSFAPHDIAADAAVWWATMPGQVVATGGSLHLSRTSPT